MKDGFDLALAGKLVPEDSPVVPNDFHLRGPGTHHRRQRPEPGRQDDLRPHVRPAPTTSPASAARCPAARRPLFLFDQLFTHFEKEEDIADLSGKLEDDLIRIHEVLDQATPNSVVIMNESLTSTALADARLLGRAVLERISERDLLCVYVTFVDELASLNEATVSMVARRPGRSGLAHLQGRETTGRRPRLRRGDRREVRAHLQALRERVRR